MTPEEEKPDDYVVLRATKVIRDRLAKVADKKNTTITALTQTAIEQYLENNEYSVDDLLKIVDTIPSLKVHEAFIKKEFAEFPSQVLKDIITTVQGRRAFVYNEEIETLKAKIDSLDKKEIHAFFFVLLTGKLEINQMNDIIKHTQEQMKGTHATIRAAGFMKDGIETRVLMFVAYKKEGEHGESK